VTEIDLKLAALKFHTHTAENPSENLKEAIEQVLKTERPDLLVTPEYTLYGNSSAYNKHYSVIIKCVKNNCTVTSNGTPESDSVARTINEIVELAAKYSSNIVLSIGAELEKAKDFPELSSDIIFNSQIIIDHNGNIIAKRRKTRDFVSEDNKCMPSQIGIEKCADKADELTLETVKTITLKNREGKEFKIFPVICGERGINRMLDKVKGANVDIIAYSENEGDASYEKISQGIQDGLDPATLPGWNFMIEDVFIKKYAESNNIVRKDGYLLVSEGSAAQGGIINLEAKKLKSFNSHQGYVVGEISLKSNTTECTPHSCKSLRWECGSGREPECGMEIECGTCEQGKECILHHCKDIPVPPPIPEENTPRETARIIKTLTKRTGNTWEITLQADSWNIISSPILEGITIDQIENSCTISRYLFNYNLQTGSYEMIGPNATLLPGKGYWVRNYGEECTINITGTEYSPEATLLKGKKWSLLGIGGTEKTIREIKNNCQYLTVFGYQKETGYYYLSDNDYLQSGRGYWVQSANDCSLYNGGTTCNETDSGNDPLHGGTTSLEEQQEKDTCLHTPYLTEYYCENNSVQEETYNCNTYCIQNLGTNWEGKCQINPDGEGYCQCTEITPSEENQKDMEKYSQKEAFLVSNEDWRAVLALVPVAIWTESNGEIKKHPMLIYHKEGDAFDADSIIYFFQQYKPDRVTVTGETPTELQALLVADHGNMVPGESIGAGLSSDQINQIETENYMQYWKSFQNVVVTEDSYALALQASIYASLINAPLIIEGFNDGINLEGKNIICIGNPSVSCSEIYSLEEIQQKYQEETKTDKIMLVNTQDLEIGRNYSFHPEKSTEKIQTIYSGMSISAPVLASAKHETIIETQETSSFKIDPFIEKETKRINPKAKYLTIVASPNAIEMHYPKGSWRRHYYSSDSGKYSELEDGDTLLDLITGRIFGITVSDASSNIARSLFYDETIKNRERVLVTRGSKVYGLGNEIYALGNLLSELGYETKNTPTGTTAEDWKNRYLIVYTDHGSNDWAGIYNNQIPWLDNSIMSINACATCKYWPNNNPRLFCANAIRKGAIAYIGTTDVASVIEYSQSAFIFTILSEDQTIGETFTDMRNYRISSRMGRGGEATEYTLLGDPTFKPPTPLKKLQKPEVECENWGANEAQCHVKIWAKKYEIPEWLQEYTSESDPVIFITGYPLFWPWGPVAFTVNSKNPELENYNMAITKPWNIVKDSANQDGKVFMGSPLSLISADEFAEDNEEEFTEHQIDINLGKNAPDISIEKIDLSGKNLTFEIENVGNAPYYHENDEIHLYLQASETKNGDFVYYEANTWRNIELDLEPGESKEFIFEVPDIGLHGHKFEDMKYFGVSIYLEEQQNPTKQQQYNNDKKEVVLEK